MSLFLTSLWSDPLLLHAHSDVIKLQDTLQQQDMDTFHKNVSIFQFFCHPPALPSLSSRKMHHPTVSMDCLAAQCTALKPPDNRYNSEVENRLTARVFVLPHCRQPHQDTHIYPIIPQYEIPVAADFHNLFSKNAQYHHNYTDLFPAPAF